MNNYKSTVLPSETVAALILACVAIDGILEAGSLTPDITEELEYLRPELNRFCTMNRQAPFITAGTQEKAPHICAAQSLM